MLQETSDYSTIERDIKEYVKDRRLQAIDFRQLNNNNIVDEETRYSKELAFQTAYTSRNEFFGYPHQQQQQQLATGEDPQEIYQASQLQQLQQPHDDQQRSSHQYLQQLYRQQLAAAAAAAVAAATATSGSSADILSASKKIPDLSESNKISEVQIFHLYR